MALDRMAGLSSDEIAAVMSCDGGGRSYSTVNVSYSSIKLKLNLVSSGQVISTPQYGIVGCLAVWYMSQSVFIVSNSHFIFNVNI